MKLKTGWLTEDWIILAVLIALIVIGFMATRPQAPSGLDSEVTSRNPSEQSK